MPGFKKGKSGNPDGRPAGSKNKIPASIREFIHEFITDNYDSFRESMKELKKDKPSEYCKYFLELFAYETPKLRSIEVQLDDVSRLSDEQAKEMYVKLCRDLFFKQNADRIPDSENIN